MSSINEEHNNNNNVTDRPTIRVGSRKSELALIQTKHVIALLQKQYPRQKFEIRTMTTMGDRVLNISLPKIGEKSLFTKDLEDALKKGSVDFVVHSLKDLPTALPEGMAIGAVLEREDPRDALVLAKQHEGKCLKTLPEGSIIGTSSLRRAAQLSRKYSHLKVQDIRGNLNTRLSKLDATDSKYAGIILAYAGLVRMGWHQRISQTIEPDDILYAVGQGALAVECSSSNTKILNMLRNLCCLETQCKILAERSFLKTLGGGCSAPVAVQTELKRIDNANDDNQIDREHQISVIGAVWSLDGKIEIQTLNKCNLNLEKAQKRQSENVTEVDHIPNKRLKLSILEDENSHNLLDSGKLSPPKIIDLSVVKKNDDSNNGSADSQANPIDLAGLINIHSDAFKKCPYSSVLTKDFLKPDLPQPDKPANNQLNQSSNEHENSSTSNTEHPLKCPLHFPIGQDVMGQCPYVDTSNQHIMQLISESVDTAPKCPFDKGNKVPGAASKCPFDKGNTIAETDNQSKCPFLSASTSNAENEITILPSNDNDNEILYCGLYRHKCWPLEIFERCENLGIELAQQLIAKGALKVMEAAQSEIRKNI